jgi:hypothetical protein
VIIKWDDRETQKQLGVESKEESQNLQFFSSNFNNIMHEEKRRKGKILHGAVKSITFALLRNTSATSGFEIISTYLNIDDMSAGNNKKMNNKYKMEK